MGRRAAQPDYTGRLGGCFDTPPGLTSGQLRRIAEEEGRILGASAASRR